MLLRILSAGMVSPVTSSQRSVTALVFVLLAIVGGVFGCGYFFCPYLNSVLVLDGSYRVAITIKSQSQGAIEKVSYATYFKPETANLAALGTGGVSEDFSFKPADDFDGNQFLAYVPWSEKSWRGIDYGHSECRFIVVKVDYEGGNSHRVILEKTPEGSAFRQMTATVP